MRSFVKILVPVAVVALSSFAVMAQPATTDERPIVVGQTFLTSGLDPAEGNAGWSLTSHGVTENLFMVNRTGEVAPVLAESAERQKDNEWTVRLRAGRSFSDGSPVTAQSVAEGLNRTIKVNPASRASAGRLTFEAIDDLTLAVTTEQPTPILPSMLAEWPFAVYKPGADDVGHLFTGAYVPVALEPGGRLELKPNPYFPANEARQSVTLIRVSDGQALALGLRSGELDLAFNLPVETLSMLRADDQLTVKSFPVAYQYMMWLNTTRPTLSEKPVRKAIAIAIDRAEIARALRSGQPSSSLWAATFPFGGEGAPTANRGEAREMLDEAGWLEGSDGIREKDGERLTLSLWAYPQRPDLVTMQPVIKQALAEIGIAIETRVTENASALASDGDFDLLLWAQHTAPAADPAFFPSLFLASNAPNNYSGWSDDRVDERLKTLSQTPDPEARVEIAREIDKLVAESAPVVMLMTPEWHVGLSEHLSGYEPWGSDYFIVRPDMGLRP